MKDEYWRAETLNGLAAHLPDESMNEALVATREIAGKWARAHALCGLADHLPRKLTTRVLQEALAAAKETDFLLVAVDLNH